MDIPVTGQQDGFSDYGSDFTPDEEEILNALLQKTPKQDDGSNKDPDLLLKDTEHERGPRSAKIPRRQGQQYQEHSPLPLSKTSITIQFDSHNDRSANSMLRASGINQASTN